MRFRVKGSPREEMNGDWEADPDGGVRHFPNRSTIKPGISHIVKWLTDEGWPGSILVDGIWWSLHKMNRANIMNALGFGHWEKEGS